jgi:hypothetical protein
MYSYQPKLGTEVVSLLTLTSGAAVSSELPSRGVTAAEESAAGVADVEPAAGVLFVAFLTIRTLDGLHG